MENEFTIDKIFGSYHGIYMDPELTDAFREYTGDAYKKMNRITRSGTIATLFTPMSKEEKDEGVTFTEKRQDTFANVARVNEIKGFFKESTPFVTHSRLILYRKIKVNSIDELKKKGTLIDKSFTSTTLSTYVAANISTIEKGLGITVRLHLLPSIPYKLYPIKYLSAAKSEEEVLFNTDMKYYLCNNAHKMKIIESTGECVDVLDCIFIPKEYSYLLEDNNREWYDRWCSIINSENKNIFTDIIPENCYHKYDQAMFHFINEIEYFIQKTIWKKSKGEEYKPKELLINDPYMTIRLFADTLISDYRNPFYKNPPYTIKYLNHVVDKIIMRCIEFAENTPKNHFRYTRDWITFILNNIRIKEGGAAAQPALQILADLNALLKAVEGAQCSNTAGLKKEIRLSIRNVKALVGKPQPRSA